MLQKRVVTLGAAFAATAIPQTPFNRAAQFEQQPALIVANDRLEATVSAQGGALVNLVLRADPESLSPLWNPIRGSWARQAGRTRDRWGTSFALAASLSL
jgi:hypothetical protein